MAKFLPTTFEDAPLLKKWIEADPWHSYKDAVEWWIVGDYLTFKLVDDQGVVIFVRFNREADYFLRLHSQFGPVSEVSERRVAMAIAQAIPEFIPHAKSNNAVGIVTESVSPKLVTFLCNRMGFKHSSSDDYLLEFLDDPQTISFKSDKL